MLAFHGDDKFRARFLDEIRWHQETDAVVQGTYGKMNGQWRGCAVGCSLRSLNRMKGAGRDTQTHARYQDELGIPEVLAHLEDRIFEGLPADVAREWPMRFSSAIRAGADLSGVWSRFAHWLLIDPQHGVAQFASHGDTRAAVDAVAALFARQIEGGTVTIAEWNEASAWVAQAAQAAEAAEAAQAAEAAWAALAARAARAAGAVEAVEAARAARAAGAVEAAEAAHFQAMADKLVELLAAAPVPARVRGGRVEGVSRD